MIFIYCYFFISSIVLIRLIYYFLFQIDRYERRSISNEFWKISILTVILWPVSLLVNFKYLKNPSLSFTHQLHYAENARKRDDFMQNPPSCGPKIQYSRNGCYGDFSFLACDIQNFIASKLDQEQESISWAYNATLNWVLNRDESSKVISFVPEICSDFDNIANELIRLGFGKVFCCKCEKEYEAKELLTNDSTEKSGWFYSRILCAQRHILLKVKGAHYYFG
jgi:hypothetical protein